MADLRGKNADATVPDIATWGTGNVLETGEGTVKVDLDDKASLSTTVAALTESDAPTEDDTLTWHENDIVTIPSESYETIFDLSGAHEILSVMIFGTAPGVKLSIDGTVVLDRTAFARGRTSGDQFLLGVVSGLRAKSKTSIKLEVYNTDISTGRVYGWRVLTREI